MEKELSNMASVTGNYKSIPTKVTSTASVVTIVEGLTITKTADKQVWADGTLTYTITVENQTTEDYTEPKITDIIDISLVEFVTGSVTIDDEPAEESQVDYQSDGTLTVTLPTITPSKTVTITFQVTKKA